MLGTLLFALAAVLQQAPDLNHLRWRNRVVLVFAPNPADKRLTEQKQAFENLTAELAERDLKVFQILPVSAEERSLRTEFGVQNQDFLVILIGKDGSAKLRRNKPVSPTELFSLIDAMPMRRAEMQQRP